MKSTTLNKLSVSIVIAVVIGVFSFAGYYLLMNKNKALDETPRVGRSISIAESFDSIQELKDRAELIALVSIKNTKPLSAGGVTFTVSESELMEVFKGKAPQTVINILETGGIENGKMISYDGNTVMQKNDQAIVFLERYVGPIVDDAYVILGVYQGKFVVDKDRIIHPNGVSEQLASITSKNELLRLLN